MTLRFTLWIKKLQMLIQLRSSYKSFNSLQSSVRFPVNGLKAKQNIFCAHNDQHGGNSSHNNPALILTYIDESAGASLAELPGLVGQTHLHNAGDVTWRGLHPDGVAGDQLTPHRDGPKDDLQAVEKVLADNDDGLTASSPALTGRDGLDLRDERTDGVQTVTPVQPPDLAAVFAVVVHEHVLAEAEQAGGVHVEGGGHRDLEPAHVPGVAGIFKAILIALQEEFQLEPEQFEYQK